MDIEVIIRILVRRVKVEEFGVRINYLYNSGFLVETEGHYLIFDYYKDEVDGGEKSISSGVINIKDLKVDKDIFVFVSHSHGDHYNPIILGWKNIRPDINYIFSSDIQMKLRDERFHSISAYDALEIKDIKIRAFGSTDMGVSFLVLVDKISIFHAGDLNWWHWYDEPEENNREMEILFKAEIEKIRPNKIDIAFFPVDLRLKEYYYLGAEYFLEAINPYVLVPMHFRENFEATSKFIERDNSYATKIIEITKRGQEIVI
jgi:L-ascorbate metabolism protein UlaG (beta-lactamase superfamily)